MLIEGYLIVNYDIGSKHFSDVAYYVINLETQLYWCLN